MSGEPQAKYSPPSSLHSNPARGSLAVNSTVGVASLVAAGSSVVIVVSSGGSAVRLPVSHPPPAAPAGSTTSTSAGSAATVSAPAPQASTLSGSPSFSWI